MKRLAMLLLALIMVLPLCGCGKVERTLEGVSMTYYTDYDAMSMKFEDGILTVQYREALKDPSSVNGKIWLESGDAITLHYRLEGTCYVYVYDDNEYDGTKYYYQITSPNNKIYNVEFSVDFLGISKKFMINYSRDW